MGFLSTIANGPGLIGSKGSTGGLLGNALRFMMDGPDWRNIQQERADEQNFTKMLRDLEIQKLQTAQAQQQEDRQTGLKLGDLINRGKVDAFNAANPGELQMQNTQATRSGPQYDSIPQLLSSASGGRLQESNPMLKALYVPQKLGEGDVFGSPMGGTLMSNPKPSGAESLIGKYNPGDYTPESFSAFLKSGMKDPSVLKRQYAPAQPTFGVIGGVPSIVDRNTRTTTPLSTPEAEAQAKGRIAAAEAEGQNSGKSRAEAQATLPAAEQSASVALDLIEKLKNHPGKRYAVGVLGAAPTVPGTPQADFVALLEQAQGKAFLEAFNTLKGGGQITEVEGKKATQAIARMQRSQSVAAFNSALDDYKAVIQGGLRRAQQRAGVSGGAPRLRFNPETGMIE